MREGKCARRERRGDGNDEYKDLTIITDNGSAKVGRLVKETNDKRMFEELRFSMKA